MSPAVLALALALDGWFANSGPRGLQLELAVKRELDLLARRLVDPDGREVPLTGMEFDLLRVLVRNPNRALSRDQLLDQAHNDSWEPFDRSIDIRIARLRKKVERDPASPELIRTIRGAGYMFVPEARG